MSAHCQHCHKGMSRGHNVSHAKNRTFRLFRPNLQHLKVLHQGIIQRVKLCTRCIKRLKKDGNIGLYKLVKYIPELEVKVQVKKAEKTVKSFKVTSAEVKKEKVVPTLDIESIVGKQK